MCASKEGYLYKQGGTWKSWQRRWFVLSNGKLSYYTDEASANKCNSDGSTAIDNLPLESAKVTLYKTQDLSRPYTIGLQPAGQKRTYVITADSAPSLKEWVKAMLDAGTIYASGSPSIDDIKTNDETAEKVSAYSTIEGWLWKRGGRIATWKFRYMIIENGILHYYKGNDPASLSQPIRSIALYDAQVHHLSIAETQDYVSHLPKGSVITGVASSIRLIPPIGLQLRSFLFCAHNETEAARWVDKIQRAIQGKDREEGEDDMPEESIKSPTPREPSPAPVAREPIAVEIVAAPEPIVPKRPEKPKKPTRELSQENTTLFFKLLDAVHNNQNIDLTPYSADLLEEINSQLLNLGLSPVEDLVQGTQPVALHATLQQNNQPTLSTPSLTSNLGVTSGWLLRQQENGEWKLRWCVINRGTKALRYWTSPADLRAHAKPLKTVSLLDCKWKTSNDENCPVVPKTNYKNETNDDVFLIVKPVNAFGSNKTQMSKLQASASQPDLEETTAAGKKAAAADKKLVPLLFAAPNPALRDQWLAAIRDASKDLDDDDNTGGGSESGEPPQPKKSITGRLSVFASGLIGGKKDKKKEEEAKKVVIKEEDEAEDDDDGADIKFSNQSVLQEQMKRETPAPAAQSSSPQPAAPRASILQNSVIGTVRTMPVDSESDDDAPPPPQRKPTVQQSAPIPTTPVHEPAPVIAPVPAPVPEPVPVVAAPVPAPLPEPVPAPIVDQAPEEEDFDENELRERIEGDIIEWIKSCQISFVYMALSLNQLFPKTFNCPQFVDLANISRGRSPEEFPGIPPQILQDAISQAYQFLAPRNIEQFCIQHGMNKLQGCTVLITAEMCAEALDSAFEDMQQ